MTKPRESIVSLDTTSYYHVVTRCVRRAFLCGRDHYSNNDYSHRRDWFMERLRLLQSVFSIEIAAYAVMSNHYHLVVFIDQAKASQWTDDEVIGRWRKVFHGPYAVQKYASGKPLTTQETQTVQACATIWRERLTNLSWFVRCLNEHIARRANDEDGCTGRFWESRFKSQALLDQQALLSCMAYVDLNPLRAKIAKTPEESDFTSVQERIQNYKQESQGIASQPELLMPLSKGENPQRFHGIQCSTLEYLRLVEWSGRRIRKDKKGRIQDDLPHILDRLEIKPENWIKLSLNFESGFRNFAGGAAVLQKLKIALHALRMPGMGFAKTVFSSG